MKLRKAYSGVFCISYIQMIILFSSNCVLWFLQVPAAVALTNETDRFTLLKFKESIINDPHKVLSMWNDSIHFCNWVGVTCSSRHQRVIALELHSYKLLGSITPHIGNLSFLRSVSLENNSFYG